MAAENATEIRQNFDNPDETRPFEKGRAEIVEVSGVTLMRATFDPLVWNICDFRGLVIAAGNAPSRHC